MNFAEHLRALREKAGPIPDRRTKRRRDRGAQRRAAINEAREPYAEARG